MRTTRMMVATATGIATALAVAPGALADDGHSWTSIYASGPYAGAGWSTCPDPIRISVDTRNLKSSERTKAKNALVAAIDTWNAAKVVTFEYGGEIPVNFDPATGVATPADGVSRDRWIYVTLVKAKEDATSDTEVVGLAGPLRIDPATNIILEGSAAFRARYVNEEPKAAVGELFAHELGHVFGLGHSSSTHDVMYPVLQGHKSLGPGDRAGARAVLKPCPSPPTP